VAPAGSSLKVKGHKFRVLCKLHLFGSAEE